jgi:(p)ppGpp synthase/HD superfamily hydrolase
VELQARDGAAFGTVVVEVENQAHLTKVIRAMRQVKGITSVERRDPSLRSAE